MDANEFIVSNVTMEFDSTTLVPGNTVILAMISANTTIFEEGDNEEYIFDKSYVRIIFLILYSLVFCLCFFGE